MHLPGGAQLHPRRDAAGAGCLGVCMCWRTPSNRIADGSGWLLPLLWGASLGAAAGAGRSRPTHALKGCKELLRWSEAFLIWLMVVAPARRPWQIAGLIACLLLAPAAEAMLGLTQFVTGNGPPSFRIRHDTRRSYAPMARSASRTPSPAI